MVINNEMALRLSPSDEQLFATKFVELLTYQIESFQVAQYKVEVDESNIIITDCNKSFPWKRTIPIYKDHFVHGIDHRHVSAECIRTMKNYIQEYMDPKVLADAKVMLGYLCDWIFLKAPTLIKFEKHDMSVEFRQGMYVDIQIDGQQHDSKESLSSLVGTFLDFISEQYLNALYDTKHLVSSILPQYSPAPLFIARCTDLPLEITFIICDYVGWKYSPSCQMQQIYKSFWK
jgi:hypothetical protein